MQRITELTPLLFPPERNAAKQHVANLRPFGCWPSRIDRVISGASRISYCTLAT